VAPELYFRQGDPNDYSDIPTLYRFRRPAHAQALTKLLARVKITIGKNRD
jgi:dienelactone hydrolase